MERYYYLKLSGQVGAMTFADQRYLNQILYSTDDWQLFRRDIIIRDNGCDLGISDREILFRINVHHINPLTIDDLINRSSKIFDPENAISTSDITHKAIHYGNENLLIKEPTVRHENDTCPWKH